MEKTVICKINKHFSFRKLVTSDASALAEFFANLSIQTQSRFGPHPLTKDLAYELCDSIESDTAVRFVVVSEDKIIGYFILDFAFIKHEAERYASYGIELDPTIDPFFAPCVADAYQNSGISSAVMKIIIDYTKQKNGRNLILLGGTQESNRLAIAFYLKWGFKECGQYFHRVNNIDMYLALKNMTTIPE